MKCDLKPTYDASRQLSEKVDRLLELSLSEPPLSTCGIDSQFWGMAEASTSKGQGWRAVLERFEQHSPASVMARAALEQALPADWIDEVFDTHRRYQYARELLFSTIVETMTLVVLGLRPCNCSPGQADAGLLG